MKLCRFPFALLLDYQEGRLDARAAARVRSHLTTNCHACRADMAWITTFVAAMQAGCQAGIATEREQISAGALQFVHNLMGAPLPEKTRSEDTRLITRPLVSWVAQLVFDSRQRTGTNTLVPARDSGRQAVHLIYRVAQIDVDVWQERIETANDNALYLIGQALPSDGSAALSPSLVTLLPGTFEQTFATEVSPSQSKAIQSKAIQSKAIQSKAIQVNSLEGQLEDGEFVFERVEAGTYTLFLRLPDQDIVLPDLRVGTEEYV